MVGQVALICELLRAQGAQQALLLWLGLGQGVGGIALSYGLTVESAGLELLERGSRRAAPFELIVESSFE